MQVLNSTGNESNGFVFIVGVRDVDKTKTRISLTAFKVIEDHVHREIAHVVAGAA
jgi:hypothetical protein